MPIPQDFNRFIPPLSASKEEEEEFADVPAVGLFDQDSEVEELPDGSAIIKLEDDFKGPDETPDFYENLSESMDVWKQSPIAQKYLELIEKDKEAREERDKQYEEGIRRTGLGHDAPGGAQFQGASKVVHPVMAEACIDFAARAIKELFPADGPVKSKILGEVTEEKTKKAERDRKSTRLNSSHIPLSRMPSSA